MVGGAMRVHLRALDVFATRGEVADDNAELRRKFEKDILVRLGDRQVRTVTDTDLRDALCKVGRSRKRARAAERMLSELRQMHGWSIQRQPWKSLLGEGNPAELVETKQVVPAGYEPVVQDRILEPQETRELRENRSRRSEKPVELLSAAARGHMSI
jgi:site-specific recombinase XerD